jgi:hypothetical protein
MAQITQYLDDELETRLRAATGVVNLSQSRWVAILFAEKLRDEGLAAVTCSASAGRTLYLARNCAACRATSRVMSASCR